MSLFSGLWLMSTIDYSKWLASGLFGLKSDIMAYLKSSFENSQVHLLQNVADAWVCSIHLLPFLNSYLTNLDGVLEDNFSIENTSIVPNPHLIDDSC